MKKITRITLVATLILTATLKVQGQIKLVKNGIVEANDCSKAGGTNYVNNTNDIVQWTRSTTETPESKLISFQIKTESSIDLTGTILAANVVEIDETSTDKALFQIRGIETKNWRSAEDNDGIDGCGKPISSNKEIRLIVEYSGTIKHNETKEVVLNILKDDTANQDSITLKVTGEDVTLSLSSDAELNFSAGPNPVNNELKISAANTIGNVQILDMTGKEVSNTTIAAKSGSVNTSNLNSGVYILKTSVEGKVITKKIVKN